MAGKYGSTTDQKEKCFIKWRKTIQDTASKTDYPDQPTDGKNRQNGQGRKKTEQMIDAYNIGSCFSIFKV